MQGTIHTETLKQERSQCVLRAAVRAWGQETMEKLAWDKVSETNRPDYVGLLRHYKECDFFLNATRTIRIMIWSNLHLKLSLRLLCREWIGREQEKKQRDQVGDTSEAKIRDDGWSLEIGSIKTKEGGILETYLGCRMTKTSDGLGGWVGAKMWEKGGEKKKRVLLPSCHSWDVNKTSKWRWQEGSLICKSGVLLRGLNWP